jgi:hypothetical protein
MNLYCGTATVVCFVVMIIPEVKVGLEGVFTSVLPFLPLFAAFISGSPWLAIVWSCVCMVEGIVVYVFAQPQELKRDAIVIALGIIVLFSWYL